MALRVFEEVGVIVAVFVREGVPEKDFEAETVLLSEREGVIVAEEVLEIEGGLLGDRLASGDELTDGVADGDFEGALEDEGDLVSEKLLETVAECDPVWVCEIEGEGVLLSVSVNVLEDETEGETDEESEIEGEAVRLPVPVFVWVAEELGVLVLLGEGDDVLVLVRDFDTDLVAVML